MPADLPPVLIPQLKPYISTSDVSLLSQALTIFAILLDSAPAVTFPEIEKDLLNDIYAIAHSPLLSGAALESLLAFFEALVKADGQIATHVVPSLVKSADSAPKNNVSLANVAKSVAQVVKSFQGIAAGTIAEFSKHIKVRCDFAYQFLNSMWSDWPEITEIVKGNTCVCCSQLVHPWRDRALCVSYLRFCAW